MKFWTLTFFVLASALTFAQSLSSEEADKFWSNQIQALKDRNVSAVMKHAEFPMKGYDGEWTEETFVEIFDQTFTESAVADLYNQNAEDLQLTEGDDGESVLMVVIFENIESDGDVFESALILQYKKVKNDWKLFQVDIAG